MLIGVLCQVVNAVASTEKEAMTISYVKDVLHQIITTTGLDANKDGMISQDEFLSLMDNQQAVSLLDEIGVDAVGVVGFADFFFEGDHAEAISVSYDEFMKLILDLRGSNSATVRDVVDLRKYVQQQFAASELRSERRSSQIEPPRPQHGSDASKSETPVLSPFLSPTWSPKASDIADIVSSEQLQSGLQKLLNDCRDDFKKCLKAELKSQLPGSIGAAPGEPELVKVSGNIPSEPERSGNDQSPRYNRHGLDDLLGKLREDTREMQQHLDHLTREICAQKSCPRSVVLKNL